MTFITANLTQPLETQCSRSTNIPSDMHEPQSPRRSPHCRICLQPRKGHPRTGCPNRNQTDSGDVTEEQRASDATRSRPVDGDSRGAQQRRRVSARPAQPQPTQHTISTEPVQTPIHPADLDNEKDSLTCKVERWLKSVLPSEPGELDPSSPRVKHEEVEETVVTGRSRQPQPLLRSMSMEERLNFLDKLKQNTKHTAQVFIMDRNEALGALDEARRQGFYGGAHVPSQGGDAFLVLGMDREAVDALLETVRAERGSPMKNCVAGAVAGAAAMWAGLAYS